MFQNLSSIMRGLQECILTQNVDALYFVRIKSLLWRNILEHDFLKHS
jgi:hypothetical protein